MEQNQKAQEAILALNASIMRTELLTRLLNPGKDINYECGYPTEILLADYKEMFDRNGIGNRVVSILPEESWSYFPEIYETEDSIETLFEAEIKKLNKEKHLLSYLSRIDALSGVGRFGILLIGINDGESNLAQPVEGIDEKTGEFKNIVDITDNEDIVDGVDITTKDSKEANNKNGSINGSVKKWKKRREVIYFKVFDESNVLIDAREEDPTSPRYGLPKTYTISYVDPAETTATRTVKVHWSRVVHITDNRTTSEVYGEPRMKKVFNYLLDIRKILAGSGEMFWKGGFPGYSFNVDPEQGSLTEDQKTDIKQEMRNYSQGLQRYLSFVGISVQALAPQVADPKGHLESQIDAICMSLGVPKRIFVGSERGELASSQDAVSWNTRIKRRQENYLDPYVIRPVIDRLIAMGCLPTVEEYFVDWEDLNTPSDKEKADISALRTEAITKYISGGGESLLSPMQFLTGIMGFTQDEAEAILDDTLDFMASEEREILKGPQEEIVDDNPNKSQKGGTVPQKSGKPVKKEVKPDKK